MTPFYRIDNRLVHGQIISTWIPHLRLKRFIIASDTVPNNRLQMSMFRMVIPAEIAFDALPVDEAADLLLQRSTANESTMVLFEEVEHAAQLFARAPFGHLNIGNVHHRADREQFTNAVYLSPDELDVVRGLIGRRARVEIQSLPSELPIDMAARLEA